MTAIFVGWVCMTALVAEAAFTKTSGNVTVTFQGDGPSLFTGSNIAPGYQESKTVTVANTGSVTEQVYTSVTDEFSNGLAAVMNLSITASTTGATYFNTTFDTFFGPNPVFLGDLAPGATRTYTYTASMPPSVGSDHQNTSMGFSLIVGFESGASVVVGGSGNGGGSSGGNTTSVTTETLPDGRVAGESTEIDPFGIARSVIAPAANFIRGMVLGERTTNEAAAAATSGVATLTDPSATGVPQRSSSPTAVFIDGEYCTLWWLLLVALISLSWSAIEDKVRNTGRLSHEFFIRNAIFTALYAAALFLFFILQALNETWWLFAGAWVVMMALDYRGHYATFGREWNAMQRNLYYSAASIFFIMTAFIFGFPCVWWPFFLVLIVSAFLFLFDGAE